MENNNGYNRFCSVNRRIEVEGPLKIDGSEWATCLFRMAHFEWTKQCWIDRLRVNIAFGLHLCDARFRLGPQPGSGDKFADDRERHTVDFLGQGCDGVALDGEEKFKVFSVGDGVFQGWPTGLRCPCSSGIADRDGIQVDLGAASAGDGHVQQIDPESIADIGGGADYSKWIEGACQLQSGLEVKVFSE